jgi:hypothetical protein
MNFNHFQPSGFLSSAEKIIGGSVGLAVGWVKHGVADVEGETGEANLPHSKKPISSDLCSASSADLCAFALKSFASSV